VPTWVVADRGYSSHSFREHIWNSGYSSHSFREHIWNTGAKPAIPAKSNAASVACPDWIYNNRNVVERLWARLKEWRAIATRYEKTASSFTGILCLAAALDWIKT
jgi:transposase